MTYLNSRVKFFLTALFAIAAGPLYAQSETLTREEVEALLAERDAVIIELQNTIRTLTARIEKIEIGSDIETEEIDSEDLDRRETAAGEDDGSRTANTDPQDPTRLGIDEVAAERALERTLVQSGALLLPRGRVEFVPTFAHQAIESEQPVSIDTISGDVVSTQITRRTSALDLLARIGLAGDSQIEIGVPYLWINERARLSSDGATLAEADQTARVSGDLRLGFAKTLVRESGWRPDVVGRLTYGFGNGDQRADDVYLGGGFRYLDATLSFVKRRDPLALLFSVGYTSIAEEDGTDPGNAYTVSLGTALAASPDSSLFGSVTYRSISKTRLNGVDVLGSDVDQMSVNLGMSTILRRGQLLNLFAQFGLSDDAPDYSLSFSLPTQW